MKNVHKALMPFFKKIGFAAKSRCPEILIAGGIVGIVGSAVMACVATTKTNKILEDAKKDIQKIHERENVPGIVYSEKSIKRDLTRVYVGAAGKFVKLYAPSIVLGALSIAGVITSNEILRRRTIALSAAYAAMDKSFKDYRLRVKERFGEETDRELRYGLKTKTIEETVIDEKTGKEKKVEKEIKVADGTRLSEYARIFDKTTSSEWVNDFEYNLMHLKQEQRWANDRLRLEGYLYLNDIYDHLGFEKTKAGQIVGWIYDPENPNIDSFVDFGITDVYNTTNVQNADGVERIIILDFNVDGPIIDLAHKQNI